MNSHDLTKQILVKKYAPHLMDMGDLISSPLHQSILSKATKVAPPRGFPLPHGSEYDNITSLTEDVIERCEAEGLSLVKTTKFVALVVKQFEGAPA